MAIQAYEFSINTTLGITIMATMILRDTHRALEEKMKELDIATSKILLRAEL